MFWKTHYIKSLEKRNEELEHQLAALRTANTQLTERLLLKANVPQAFTAQELREPVDAKLASRLLLDAAIFEDLDELRADFEADELTDNRKEKIDAFSS